MTAGRQHNLGSEVDAQAAAANDTLRHVGLLEAYSSVSGKLATLACHACVALAMAA
jgi:hypothetical protein